MQTAAAMVRRCRSITSLANARIANQMTVLSLMVEAYQVRWGKSSECR
jgi:hypothetical protein